MEGWKFDINNKRKTLHFAIRNGAQQTWVSEDGVRVQSRRLGLDPV